VANTTITVARKTREIPELRAAVDHGQLSVSKASRIVSGLTKENASEVISFAMTHTSNEIDEEMARRNPRQPRRDSNRPIGNDMVELRAQISTATNMKLKRAHSLLASKGKPTNLDGVLSECLELYLEHHDPVRKAKRAEARAAKQTEQGSSRSDEKKAATNEQNAQRAERKFKPAQAEQRNQSEVAEHLQSDIAEHLAENPAQASSSGKCVRPRSEEASERTNESKTSHQSLEFCANRESDAAFTQPGFKSSDTPATLRHRSSNRRSPRRKIIKAASHHAVMLRTGGRCAFVNERGERCNEDRFLHLHHIVPLSQGGSDEPSNLTYLCSGHHALVHQLNLGIDGQISWLRSPRVAYLA
jgi:5-methylcytosine-specific restriction endonuclease McrA